MDALNILIVDDEPDVCKLLKMKLTRESPEFSIRTAHSGAECLEQIRKDNIDCILSDYQMPVMNGMELLEAVKEQGMDIPFIFVTGQGSEDVARQAFRSGAEDYFTKDLAGFAFASRMANSIKQSVYRRKWTADILRKAAEGVPLGSGKKFFDSLTRFIANTLQVDIAFIGELSEATRKDIDIISVFAHGQKADNFSYSLENTPCRNVVDNRPCIYTKNVQRLFPDDEMLVQMGLESYGGVPLYDSAGRPIGLLVVVHSKPITNEDIVQSLLLILAERAGAELEMMRAARRVTGHDGLNTSTDAASRPIVIIKPGHSVYMMNNSAREQFMGGDTNKRLDGLKCHKLLHGLDEPCGPHEGIKCPFDESFSSGETVKAVHFHTMHDGRKTEMEVVASPMYAETGEIHAVVEVFGPCVSQDRQISGPCPS